MREVLHNCIRQWTKVHNIAAPRSFSEWCPHCQEKVTFSTTNHQHDTHRTCISSSSKCPGCDHHIGIWAIGRPSDETSEVYMHPNNGGPHQPKDVESNLNEALFRSYVSTVDAYNSGNYVATAVCCRRTLEGLFQGFLQDDQRNQTLARAIQSVANSADLSAPISNLANVLRKGGNLGAHFDMEKEPDESMALQMLELLENLIDYLHVLPSEISNLEQALDRDA